MAMINKKKQSISAVVNNIRAQFQLRYFQYEVQGYVEYYSEYYATNSGKNGSLNQKRGEFFRPAFVFLVSLWKRLRCLLITLADRKPRTEETENNKREQMSNSHENSSKEGNQHQKLYMETHSYLENEPDLYLILRDKIYPTHLSLMKKSCFISKKLSSGENVLILNIEAENQVFQNALELVYEGKISFPRDANIEKLIKVGEELQFVELQLEIYRNILNNFGLYDIFIIYRISTDHKKQWLTDKCDQQLTLQDYKQLNFSRDQLLHLGKETFLKILKNHKNLKARNIIVGLTQEEILQLIEEYQNVNRQKLEKNQVIEKPIKNRKQIQSGITTLPEMMENQNIEGQDDFSSESGDCNSPELYQNKIFPNLNPLHQKKELMEEDRSIKDQFFELDYVASPVINLEEFGQKLASFESWSFNQENKFMVIENEKSCGQISQRDSDQEEDQINENQEEINYAKKQKNKGNVPALPEINKHFVV